MARVLPYRKLEMNIDKLYEDLREDEGEVLSIYKDHLGYLTFGIGHLVTAEDEEYGKPVGTPISLERCRDVFAKDVGIAINECERLYPQWHNWPEEVQLILVNMMFNLGATRLAKFQNMKNMLNQRKWQDAAAEGRDSLWYRQVTNRAERLMTRLERLESLPLTREDFIE